MNSVKFAQTTDSLTAGIILTFRNPVNRGKVIIAVEGDDDSQIYSNVFSDKAVILSVLKSKAYFESVFSKIPNQYSSRLIGICDADFCNVLAQKSPCSNIFYTDSHDAEIMFLSKGTCDEIYGVYGLPTSDRISFEAVCKSLFDISAIKWYNAEVRNDICFDNIHVDPFIREDGTVDVTKYITRLFSSDANKDKQLNSSDIILFVEKKSGIDYPQITNGHDAYRYIYQHIRKRNQQLAKKHFKKSFISCCRPDYFKKTNLYFSILDWATSQGHMGLFN